MATRDLIVYQKTFDYCRWQRSIVIRFAKVHKYSIGIELQKEGIALLKWIVRANVSRQYRAVYIEEALGCVHALLVNIRFGWDARDSGGISTKQYHCAADMLLEIERMLSGWLKQTLPKIVVEHQSSAG